MKRTILNIGLLITGILLTISVNAQSTVWATVESLSELTQTEEYQEMQSHYGFSIEKPLSNSRNPKLQKVYEFSCNCDEVDLYTSLHKLDGVKGIEYGPTYKTLSEPDDYALFENYNNGTNSSWHLELIWAFAAWDLTTGTEKIAISDQNIFPDHEDLQNKLIYYDATNTSSQGHGTAVATLAGGESNNGVGIASVGYDSPIGFFRMNYNEVLAAAYDGYKVINMSWTSGCNYNQYIESALQEAYDLGSFLIASAGNGTTCGGAENLVYPSAYDIVFSVTSTGHDDKHDQPNGNTHQHNSTVDLAAPGYDVPLTAAPGWTLFGSGTSYAAPIVSGAAALIISVYPTITPAQIKSILQLTSTNIDALNPNYIGLIGTGRLNVGEAVKVAYAYYLQSLVVSPLDPVTDPSIEDSDLLGDGNNGHGNDIGGFDPSNPGNGNGNNGNGNNGNGKPNTNDDPFATADPKSVFIPNGIYDMTGKKVNLDYAITGIYLVIENGVVIRKIWKS